MIDMGVPAYLVASSVIAILAQRLVRVNCSKCKQKYIPSEAVLESAGITPEMAKNANFMKGKGCSNCGKSGFRGRLGIFELLLMTARIREMAFSGTATQEIRKAARAQGMHTLYEDGVDKVLKGITTVEEVYRVAKRVDS